jgi:hypothetical protein
MNMLLVTHVEREGERGQFEKSHTSRTLKQKGHPFGCPKLLNLLVAGEGFEPSTFGL